jgi:hypothetical protein
MGEYAMFQGRQVKIGTCENMYCLRADQATIVKALEGNVDPVKDRDEIRFRFPFPDEDRIDPGAFEDYNRSLALHGLAIPEGVEHDSVQFTAPEGYLVSIPCPEGPSAGHGLKVHRNGFAGSVGIVQQRWVGPCLVTICACGGCGARYRLATIADAQPVIDACKREASANPRDARGWLEIAARIAKGYAL